MLYLFLMRQTAVNFYSIPFCTIELTTNNPSAVAAPRFLRRSRPHRSSTAIRCDPTNVRYLWERSHLHMRLGEQKHCMDGYRKILSLLPREEGEHFMQLSKDMAK